MFRKPIEMTSTLILQHAQFISEVAQADSWPQSRLIAKVQPSNIIVGHANISKFRTASSMMPKPKLLQHVSTGVEQHQNSLIIVSSVIYYTDITISHVVSLGK